jgi:hypothetical protein
MHRTPLGGLAKQSQWRRSAGTLLVIDITFVFFLILEVGLMFRFFWQKSPVEFPQVSGKFHGDFSILFGSTSFS